MHINDQSGSTIEAVTVHRKIDEAELAAAAFLARYSGRTLEAHRHDLRGFFEGATSVGLEILSAARPHIELFRHHMELQGLAASTIDRRLATACRLYRFAHIDGRITANPAQYTPAPKCTPPRATGSTAPNSDGSCSRPNASTVHTPR